MATVVRTASIPGPRHAVWALLADFAAISAWAPNVDHSCLLSTQAEGVGMVRRIQSGRTTVVETVTVFEPEAKIGYELSGLPPAIARATNTWTLDAVGEETVATLTTAIEAGPRPPHKAIARVVGRVMGAASDQMLGGLAARFERDDAS